MCYHSDITSYKTLRKMNIFIPLCLIWAIVALIFGFIPATLIVISFVIWLAYKGKIEIVE
jgi:hypothetical protein